MRYVIKLDSTDNNKKLEICKVSETPLKIPFLRINSRYAKTIKRVPGVFLGMPKIMVVIDADDEYKLFPPTLLVDNTGKYLCGGLTICSYEPDENGIHNLYGMTSSDLYLIMLQLPALMYPIIKINCA